MRWATFLLVAAGTALIGVVVVVVAGLLVWGYPPETAAGGIHSRWVHHFGTQLWEGDLYPRWLIGPNSGFGSATFWYYPPLPFWVSSLYYPFVPTPWHALGWSAATGLLVSGATSFTFFRRLVSVKAAAMASLCYVIAPYPLGHVLFVHGAYAQFWAFAWMPLVLLGIDRSVRDSRAGKGPLVIALALLFLTHVLTAIVFAPFAAAYALVVGRWGVRALGTAFAWALGLTAIYWLPIFWVQEKIAGADQPLFQGKLLENTFFFQGWSTLEAISPFIEGFDNGFLLAIYLLTLLMLYLASWWGGVEPRRLNWLGWTLIGLGAVYLLMQTPLGKPVFTLLPPLQRIQFASRLMSPATLVVASVLALLGNWWRRQAFLARVISAGAIAVWVAAAMASTGWKWVESYGLTTTPLAQVGPPETGYAGRDAIGEYIPGKADIYKSRKFFGGDESPLQAKWRDGEGNLTVKKVGGGFHIPLPAARSGEIVFHQFYFPGWSARETGSHRRVELSRLPGTGLMQIEVPPGTSGIDLKYGTVPVERVGAAISLVSLMASAALWARKSRDRGREPQGPEGTRGMNIGYST